MRIGVDARHLADGRGVARYTRETLAALSAGFPQDEFVLFVSGRGTVVAPPGDNLVLRRSALPGRLVFGTGAVVGRPRLERMLGGDLDVVWLPAPAPVGLAGDVPLVLTVHDLSFVSRLGDFTPYERLWHRAGRLEALTRGATRVVAVSDATRAALVAAWALPAEHIDVVHPGVWRGAGDASPTPEQATSIGSGESDVARYVLFVGGLEPRKAPDVLVDAFAAARARGLRAELVVAGEGRMHELFAGRDGVRALGAVRGADLDALFRGALAVVLPSWLEGFGFPPLEGLARGVPAIVSDLAVYDETLGAGALRVPAGDAGALAGALLRIEGDAALRGQLVTAGQAAIAPLTWEACATGVRAALARAVAS